MAFTLNFLGKVFNNDGTVQKVATEVANKGAGAVQQVAEKVPEVCSSAASLAVRSQVLPQVRPSIKNRTASNLANKLEEFGGSVKKVNEYLRSQGLKPMDDKLEAKVRRIRANRDMKPYIGLANFNENEKGNIILDFYKNNGVLDEKIGELGRTYGEYADLNELCKAGGSFDKFANYLKENNIPVPDKEAWMTIDNISRARVMSKAVIDSWLEDHGMYYYIDSKLKPCIDPKYHIATFKNPNNKNPNSEEFKFYFSSINPSGI